MWKKTVLMERQRCFGEILEEDILLDYNNYVLSVFNSQIRRYVTALPKQKAIAKIRETYELFKELLDKIVFKDNLQNNDNKYPAIKTYLEYEPYLKAGQYDQIYDFFYSHHVLDSSTNKKVKDVIRNTMGKVRTFILFGW